MIYNVYLAIYIFNNVSDWSCIPSSRRKYILINIIIVSKLGIVTYRKIKKKEFFTAMNNSMPKGFYKGGFD